MSRQVRRKIRPPTGIGLEYASILRKWLEQAQALILSKIENAWPHTDAFVRKKLAWTEINLAETLDPAGVTPHLEKFAKKVSARGRDEFRRVIGIPTTDIGTRALIDQFRDRNVGLIKSLVGQQINQIESILESADSEAVRVEVLRGRLINSFGVTKSKADLLARDQVLKLNGQLTQVRHQNAGITKYIWRTSGDERVRESHAALDGTVQEWASPPVIDDDGRTGHPGDDYQCRCTADPILPELEDEVS